MCIHVAVLYPDTQADRQKETLASPRDCESSEPTTLAHLYKQDTSNPTRAQPQSLHSFTNWGPRIQREEPVGVQQIYTITEIEPKKEEL